MTIVERIAASPARPLIDSLILSNTPVSGIVKSVAEKYDILFEPSDIEQYRQNIASDPNSPIRQIAKVASDLGSAELPPSDELGRLSINFSFQKTNEDLDLIYERIRELKQHAILNPGNSTYDKRIAEYIAKAEAIRTRVFRHQYEQIRHAILLTVGKKICTAAVSILMPYIHKEHKEEAMRRFQAAIEPLLEVKMIPPPPSDISDGA